MSRNRRFGLAIAFAVLAAAPTATAAGAAPSSTASAASQIAGENCGYWSDGFGRSFYTHCGGTKVVIKIDYYDGDKGERCVPPGETFLDGGKKVTFAYYAGRLC
ncbi:DUF6355 family natural product biosynthesis protein [Allokutzneria sp. NRRL B-24872]|uniref:DUF6355 family natural product biosynthesis protein n=1 Tax=Allokutzneria sp. NRRL B-24872 TaxID=1137961 RepID=UPI000A39B9DE|nr:DUF6355 family natural product biosynthesis protein [Allokutzneria sp. NRRL B-24872]